ncbi:MAG TPA: AhpC/TSA family protein [Anaerolineae bacterium]|nr:AhpC/TSA family protein [Anaerolineae bacterium]
MVHMRKEEARISEAGGSLAVVGVGSPAQAAHFLQRFPMAFPLLADPDQAARQAYSVRSGNLGDLMGPATWTAYAQAIPRHGVAPAVDRQAAALLPGSFVIDRSGRIRLAHYARSVIDWLPVDQLLAALREAAAES